MYGFTGNILRIDLKNKKAIVEPLKENVLRKFIGGRGIGAWILGRELPPSVDPLSPENKLVISVGPLAGTKALGTQVDGSV